MSVWGTCAQWAERLLEGGGNEQWGDKWEERFKNGAGSKQVRYSLPTLCCTPQASMRKRAKHPNFC